MPLTITPHRFPQSQLAEAHRPSILPRQHRALPTPLLMGVYLPRFGGWFWFCLFCFCLTIFLSWHFPLYVVFLSREGRPWFPVDRCCFVPYCRGWQPIHSCLEQVAKDEATLAQDDHLSYLGPAWDTPKHPHLPLLWNQSLKVSEKRKQKAKAPSTQRSGPAKLWKALGVKSLTLSISHL